MREEEEERQAAGFCFMTVALGILSHATAPHRYTLLHVSSLPACVCWRFTGGFLFNSTRWVLSGLPGSGPGLFFLLFLIGTETLSPLQPHNPANSS